MIDSEAQKKVDRLLDRAEKLLGPRDRSWSHPRVQSRKEEESPHTDPDKDNRSVTVFVSYLEGNFEFEAAHEVVHCLNPITLYESIYLEEAVATDFSRRIVCRSGKTDYWDQKIAPTLGKYQVALDRAMRLDNDVIRLGRRVRDKIGYGSLSTGVSSRLIQELYPGASEAAVVDLLQRFA